MAVGASGPVKLPVFLHYPSSKVIVRGCPLAEAVNTPSNSGRRGMSHAWRPQTVAVELGMVLAVGASCTVVCALGRVKRCKGTHQHRALALVVVCGRERAMRWWLWALNCISSFLALRFLVQDFAGSWLRTVSYLWARAATGTVGLCHCF